MLFTYNTANDAGTPLGLIAVIAGSSMGKQSQYVHFYTDQELVTPRYFRLMHDRN